MTHTATHPDASTNDLAVNLRRHRGYRIAAGAAVVLTLALLAKAFWQPVNVRDVIAADALFAVWKANEAVTRALAGGTTTRARQR